MLKWILIGVGSFIIVLIILAIIVCILRDKIFKKRRPKKPLPDKNKNGQSVQQPMESYSNANEYQPPPVIIDLPKKKQKPKDVAIKNDPRISSIQTAVLPPQGLRSIRNTDELYRLALTSESSEERNVYLDATIESANEEIQVWSKSKLSKENNTATLPIIARRMINAKKAGVKLITTHNPTKLIPEQMDGLTYEQINDLALIEIYPNVRYSLFERAVELIKRAFDDAPSDAQFDKENLDPLLYQYQRAIFEINEERPEAALQRNKLVDEILLLKNKPK